MRGWGLGRKFKKKKRVMKMEEKREERQLA